MFYQLLADIFRNLNDEELNMVLISLVEYLGHNNPIISGAAFNEVNFLQLCSNPY